MTCALGSDPADYLQFVITLLDRRIQLGLSHYSEECAWECICSYNVVTPCLGKRTRLHGPPQIVMVPRA